MAFETEDLFSPEEMEMIDQAPDSRKAHLKKQIQTSKLSQSQSLDEKVRAEKEYRESIGSAPGLIISQVVNKSRRTSVDGRIYKSQLPETLVVSFIPYQTNMAQPGYAQRLLRKGIKVEQVFRKEEIANFLKAVRGSDGGEKYLENMGVFDMHMENTSIIESLKKDSDNKDVELSELRRKLEELQGQRSSTIKPKGK